MPSQENSTCLHDSVVCMGSFNREQDFVVIDRASRILTQLKKLDSVGVRTRAVRLSIEIIRLGESVLRVLESAKE